MIKNEVVSRSISYIMQHLDEEISIEDVANYCHFSKYYFSRLFKEETGESIYAFIKRLRMEQSALRLKIEKEKTITDIGFAYGYSPSNYSSVFKKHHHISPAEFRKHINGEKLVHPFHPNKCIKFPSFDFYNKHISIQMLEDFFVIYERHIGSYIDLGKKWCEFTQRYEQYRNKDTLLIERAYDDPSITCVEKCLYDICMTVDKNCPLDNVMTISGGKFAVYRFEGYVQDIFSTYQGMFHIWISGSGYELDERYGLDIYRLLDAKDRRVVMDICIPIK